jgi:hypothetical protein
MRQITTRVVGVTFVPGYPDNLYRLQEVAAERYLSAPGTFGATERPEGLPVVLIRNPDNAYDANAIEVHVPALSRHGMIGHLPRELAERLAPKLDAGEDWLAEIVAVLVSPENPSNPGIEIECWLADRETV